MATRIQTFEPKQIINFVVGEDDKYNEYIMSSRNNEHATTTTPSVSQLKQGCFTHIYNSHRNDSPHFIEPAKNSWMEDAQFEWLSLICTILLTDP